MAKTNYTTVTDVPLIRVGTWNPAEGDGTVTLDILNDIVAASQDPRLNIPVIKLGHVDERFDNPDYFEDGEPAYGQISNLRVTEDEGGTLVGDLINIPEMLADVMESAYPHRSVEIYFGVQLTDQAGEVLEEFSAVLTALALLGEAPPAVSGLGAIHESFSGRKSAARSFRVDQAGKFALTAGHTFESLRTQLRALLDARTGTDEYVWIADLDDSMVIYESEGPDGYTNWREAFVINTDGTVTLSGQPEQVVRKTSFEPVAVNSAFPHFKSGRPQSVRVQKPVALVAAGKPTTSLEDTVTPEQIKKLREQGLIAAEVTDDAVLAALNPDATQSSGDEEQAEDEQTQELADQEAPAAPVAAAAAPVAPATVQVSAASFADMQTRLTRAESQLAENAKQETAKRHNAIIANAKREGRIHPKDEANYRKLLSANESDTTALLAGLQPVIHTSETGSAQAAFTVGTDDAVAKAQADLDAKTFGGK